MTDVLLNKRKNTSREGRDTQNVMMEAEMEMLQHPAKDNLSGTTQKVEQGRPSPRAFKESTALSTPQFQAFSLQK